MRDRYVWCRGWEWWGNGFILPALRPPKTSFTRCNHGRRRTSPTALLSAPATRARSQVGLTLATISLVLGAVDAVTTHIGLRGGRLAESNPAALWLYRRVPPPVFIVTFALASGIISLALFQLLGPEAQAGFVAVGVLPPLWNTWLILRSRRRG